MKFIDYDLIILILFFLKVELLFLYLCGGELAERSIAAVLKTVEGNTSGGSNPSLSANNSKSLDSQSSIQRLFLKIVSPD
jgi:hypothetical protein